MTDVRFPTPAGGELNAYLAKPSTAGQSPGVIVLHEAFGLNDDIRAWADRFAAEGYVALAPELFHRFAPGYEGSYDDIPASIALAGKLVPESVIADFVASGAALDAHAAVARGRIGAIGYCMGGGMAFASNAVLPLRAAVSYYGTPPAEMQAQLAATLHGPMLFVWAERGRTRSSSLALVRRIYRLGMPNSTL